MLTTAAGPGFLHVIIFKHPLAFIYLSCTIYSVLNATTMTVLCVKVIFNRALRRIFRSKRDEVTGGRRKLHNEERHSLYSSPIRMIKSRRMR
jgi:hypothetical protein